MMVKKWGYWQTNALLTGYSDGWRIDKTFRSPVLLRHLPPEAISSFTQLVFVSELALVELPTNSIEWRHPWMGLGDFIECILVFVFFFSSFCHCPIKFKQPELWGQVAQPNLFRKSNIRAIRMIRGENPSKVGFGNLVKQGRRTKLLWKMSFG